MSEILADEEFTDESDDASASDEIGMTSSESSDTKKSLFSSMTIFDAMLLLSLVFIALATLLLLIELGNPLSFPWRTKI